MNRKNIEKLLEFRKDRDWNKFHTGLNLSHKLLIEAAEVAELFEWGGEPNQERLVEELADVAIILQYLINDFKIDINSAVSDKIEKNAQKYPIKEYSEWKS